ncbi:MetQ/NlpA family ABC transporter substrate-binding protein [Arenibaculum sp.]|uniref:MetQ/NlpA family ABC transporter substrate-binding protein n=1 Tax=Arenibaculum sp. TaxID=2865862 RepID=UPI002E11B6DA|nr:MetQ/NlpA family ABC transporter substrate-binding protein [Arenibaculum sp.]
MKFRLKSALLGLALLSLPAAAGAETVKVGVAAGDDEVIWQQVKEVAAKDGLDVELIVFNDYLLPNAALDAGDLDANSFQHKPFLENEVRTKGYELTAIADTIVAPIGLYSNKVDDVADIPQGGQIGVANDPSNGGRGLLLLEAEGLIELRDGAGILPTPLDITANPRDLRIVELDAAQLPRSLDDLDAAVVNNNYAVLADLKPSDAIAIEPAIDNPYGNVIAVRTADKDKPVFDRLVAAYHSDEIRKFIEDHFKGALIPAF